MSAPRSRKLYWKRLSVVSIFIALAGGAFALHIRHQRAALSPPVIREAPPFTLLNQDRETVSLDDLRGRVKLLSFIYVRCSAPTQCPLTTRLMRETQERIAAAGAADRAVFLSASFDPLADTPAVLRAYGELYGADFVNWHFLTAAPDTVAAICADYGVIYEQAAPDVPDIRHSVLTYLIDGDNYIRRVYLANAWQPEDVAADMLAVMTPDKRSGKER